MRRRRRQLKIPSSILGAGITLLIGLHCPIAWGHPFSCVRFVARTNSYRRKRTVSVRCAPSVCPRRERRADDDDTERRFEPFVPSESITPARNFICIGIQRASFHRPIRVGSVGAGVDLFDRLIDWVKRRRPPLRVARDDDDGIDARRRSVGRDVCVFGRSPARDASSSIHPIEKRLVVG